MGKTGNARNGGPLNSENGVPSHWGAFFHVGAAGRCGGVIVGNWQT